MRDMLGSCAAGYLESTPLLDLNYLEDSGGGPDVVLAVQPNLDKVRFRAAAGPPRLPDGSLVAKAVHPAYCEACQRQLGIGFGCAACVTGSCRAPSVPHALAYHLLRVAAGWVPGSMKLTCTSGHAAVRGSMGSSQQVIP